MPARRAVLAAAVGLVGGLLLPGCAASAEVKVAVAANFAEPAREIARRFAAATGHRAALSLGSSGQLYAQIHHGAPFQVFLSADAETPRRAETAGLAARGARFTYATGRLVLWSRTPEVVASADTLRRGAFEKIAIAEPRTAPYGTAALETLRRLGLHQTLAPKIVTGTSVTQAYQFVETGAAELGFVALSQVIGHEDGSRWIVPSGYHAAIDQQAVLLKRGVGDPAALAFLDFLKGPEARAIIRRYGYEVA